MKYDYNTVEKAILTQNVDILLKYKDTFFWITVGKKSCFGDDNGIISLIFSTPQQLLSSILIENKKLFQIWDEVEVESYDSGWSKTINVK